MDAQFFEDHEINAVHQIINDKTIDTIPILYTQHQKAIVQQIGKRGCTAAAAYMLILDRIPDYNYGYGALRSCDIGNEASIKTSIDKAQLKMKSTLIQESNFENVLNTLKHFINVDGSAIVDINHPKYGQHVVIVDAVENNTQNQPVSLRLRDPYHGWEITVKAEAFIKYITNPTSIIQIAK
jgi:hypothetical protein